MTAQLQLFDTPPPDIPETAVPAVLHGHEANEKNGHLLIASRVGDWLFLNTGNGRITCCLPGWDTAVDLDTDQLRVLGDYCHRMADRIEPR